MIQNKKSLIAWAVTLIIGLSAFIFLFDFPKQINITYPAVEFELGNETSAEETTLIIKGTLKRPLFRNRIFEGQISVDKYPATTDNIMLSGMEFIELENDKYASGLFYLDANFDMVIFGAIYTDKEFGQVNLAFQEQDGNSITNENPKSTTRLLLSAPASSYEEADQIYNQLKEKTD